MESSNESKDALISNFCSITGVEASRGQFYLESANWSLQLAIQSYFEQQADDIEPNAIPGSNTNTEPPGSDAIANQPIVDHNESDVEMSSLDMSSTKVDKELKKQSKRQTTSKFATLDTLRQQTDSGASSEEEGQAFYAGGSERSGQQVLGPKKNKNTDELITQMFASAKAHGAEVVDPNEKRHKSNITFSGTGFRLGSTSGDTNASQIIPSSSSQRKPNKEIVLKLWRNGFSLNDEPLRDYEDPNNHEFLASIDKGEIPRELIQRSSGVEVNLNMEDHRHEDYVKTKKALEAFTGEGYRLGNPSADLVTSDNSLTDAKSAEEEALKCLDVNQSQPMTRLQIRLLDGTRVVLNLNLSHTINDIRRYICQLRPIYATNEFVLMTTFPNKVLTDETLTLKDANLANASIVQKLNK